MRNCVQCVINARRAIFNDAVGEVATAGIGRYLMVTVLKCLP
jgi:hypothetical protein